MLKLVTILTMVILSSGCIKARDYFSAEKGAVRMNLVFPFGEGRPTKNYIVVENIVIDKGDTKKIVEKKLGKPSYIGRTLEGWEFYRYEEKALEVYFDRDRVVGFKKIEFYP